MKALHIRLKAGTSLDAAWEAFFASGIEVLYSSEDPEEGGEVFVVQAKHAARTLKKKFPFIAFCEPVEFGAVDWERQWKEHGLQFADGLVHLDLKPFGSERMILLKPGPGFGDMSHPTTALVLEMMSSRVQGKAVLDIGSGSGVLAIAAAACGAFPVFGVEIDPLAIAHAEENARLNKLEKAVHFLLPAEAPVLSEAILLMNMIQSEQKDALEPLKLKVTGEAIVSGILLEEKEDYLKTSRQWGWKLEEEREKEGWLGMRFSIEEEN